MAGCSLAISSLLLSTNFLFSVCWDVIWHHYHCTTCPDATSPTGILLTISSSTGSAWLCAGVIRTWKRGNLARRSSAWPGLKHFFSGLQHPLSQEWYLFCHKTQIFIFGLQTDFSSMNSDICMRYLIFSGISQLFSLCLSPCGSCIRFSWDAKIVLKIVSSHLNC